MSEKVKNIRIGLSSNVRTLIKLLLILAFLSSLSSPVTAQWICRSKLPSALKPFSESFPLKWGMEGTFAHGRLSDRDISNVMLFGALDYSTLNQQFYFEYAWKYWRNASDIATADKHRFGLRELMYRYSPGNSSFIVGLHRIVLGDYFLVNERAAGISLSLDSFADGQLSASFKAASVTDNVSRYGTFCSVKYLYDIIPGRSSPFQGDKLGETNFIGGVLTWTPSAKSKPKPPEPESADTIDEFEEFDDFESADEFDEFTEADEFEEFESTDEFDEFDDFEAVEESPKRKKKKQWLKKVGLIGYSEVGSEIDVSRYYGGAMVEFSLLYDITFETEALLQQVNLNQALIYYLALSDVYVWNFGSRTSWSAAYISKYDIDDDARVGVSFSNLFIGEIVRLDLADIPLYQFAIKHNYPPIQTHIKLQVVGQSEGDNMREIDLALGKTFFWNYKLTAIFSRIESDRLADTEYMGRLELRAVF